MSRLKGFTTVLAVCLMGAFAYGCGGDDGATQEQLDQARAEGAKEAKEEAKLSQLQKQIKQLQKKSKQKTGGGNQAPVSSGGSGGSSGGSGPVSTCSGGVQVGPNTSCDFAMNVAGEYGSNPGASSVGAYSPVTGKYYTMSCSPWGSGTVCAGGNNASVYLP